jgi:membrane associated rhomboid family serine protease
MRRWPIANIVIIGVTVAASMWVFADPPWERGRVHVYGNVYLPGEPDYSDTAFVLARQQFQPSQLVGHVFAHGGWVHLIGNMVFLFVFGNAVNARLGNPGYAFFYVAGGVTAGLGWLWLGDGPAAVGASGAISAVTGAFLILYPRNDVKMYYLWWMGYIFRTGAFAMPSILVIALYAAFDVAGILLGGAGVAYEAHLAGAAFGIAVASALALTRLVKSSPYEQNLFEWISGSEVERVAGGRSVVLPRRQRIQ